MRLLRALDGDVESHVLLTLDQSSPNRLLMYISRAQSSNVMSLHWKLKQVGFFKTSNLENCDASNLWVLFTLISLDQILSSLQIICRTSDRKNLHFITRSQNAFISL